MNIVQQKMPVRPLKASNQNRAAWFLLLLGFALTSCTPSSQPLATMTFTHTQTVAIVPSIPTKFRVATEGLIGDHVDLVDDSAWQLNDLVFYVAANALAQNYSVSEVLPDTDLGSVEKEQTSALNETPDLGTILRQHIHPSKPADVYIVFDTDPSADGLLSHPEPSILKGVGVSDQTIPFGTLAPAVHTFLQMTVINGKSFRTIFSLPLRIPTPPDQSSSVLTDLFGEMGVPAQPLPNFKWQTTWAAMSQEQKKQILNAVDNLLCTSIPHTLSWASYCIETASSACDKTFEAN